MVAARYKVIGRVQGVGFRYFAQRAGRELGLRGWVRNAADGSVEVVARGPAARLRQMEAQLRQGPPSAWVEAVVVAEAAPEEVATYAEFVIEVD